MTTPTTDDLPPLPGHLGFADVVRAAGPVYTADQMREYARAAIEQAAVPEGWRVYVTNDYIPPRLRLEIGVQSFDIAVDYAEEEPERLDWFCDMLTKAMKNATSAPKQQPALGRGECGGVKVSLTDLEAYKAFLFSELKKDCDRPSGNAGGKKVKYTVEHNMALLAVRYPRLAKAMK